MGKKQFFKAIFNLILFLPYYFSTLTLLQTLFSPWKNYHAQKQSGSFDLRIWLNNLSFNLISRMMGFVMRILFIFVFFVIQIIFVLSIPFLIIIYFLLTPVLFLLSFLKEDKNQIKNNLKEKFVKSHMIRPENQVKVEVWFEKYYQKYICKEHWWSIKNLFSTPPLARDWAMGYTPYLDKYAEELTNPEYQIRTKNIVNRTKEIKEIESSLLKSKGANVLIVGEEGVGKHTVIDALAKMIYEGKINPILAYKRILKLNMERILAEFTDMQKRENFLSNLLEEAIEAKNIVLMIENFDHYISSGANKIDLTIIFEKFAKSDFCQIIGITSPFAYQKYIYSNDKLNKLFNKVDIYEVTAIEAENILFDIVPRIEKHYNFIIPYETIQNTIEKSDFFITHIPFPEKAIELLDSACAYIKQQKNNVGTGRDLSTLMPDIIDTVLTQKTHISTVLTPEIKQKLINLETMLNKSIISQKEAIDDVASVLRRSFLLLSKRKKPLATFLFLGPTGVGKTECAKVLSQIFFGSDQKLIRFDMSLYQSRQDIPQLISLLTEAIRKNPYGVLLLDEIEKADHDLLNIFMTVLDEGYLTDGIGKRVDCKNLIVICTSNAETNNFLPEFLNRFDGIHVFNKLSQEAVVQIGKKMLNKIIDDIYKMYKVRLNIRENTLLDLTKKGYDDKFGARNMERLLRQEIEDKAAKMILSNQVKSGETIDI